jgi:hypothetical protein
MPKSPLNDCGLAFQVDFTFEWNPHDSISSGQNVEHLIKPVFVESMLSVISY